MLISLTQQFDLLQFAFIRIILVFLPQFLDNFRILFGVFLLETHPPGIPHKKFMFFLFNPGPMDKECAVQNNKLVSNKAHLQHLKPELEQSPQTHTTPESSYPAVLPKTRFHCTKDRFYSRCRWVPSGETGTLF